MRTIFISPLLWQRLTRATRRRSERQVVVLLALAALVLIFVIGLAIDGLNSYIATQRLQATANEAALRGVVWMPNKPEIADSQGRSEAQNRGYKVYANSSDNPTPKPVTLDTVRDNPPGAYTAYEANNPAPLPGQYRVRLTTKVENHFLAILGVPNVIINRDALATYIAPARVGSSFNYLGTSAMPYDWMIPAMAGQGDAYYRTLFDRYFASNCQKEPGAPAPDPTKPCVGTFWLSIAGPHGMHSTGDAYTPVGDGAISTNSGGAFTGGVMVNSGNPSVGGCQPAVDPVTWFITLTSPACATALATTSPLPILNQDTHPDGGGRRGFGYEFGIQVDGAALTDNGNPSGNNTRLNVYIYDAAMAEKASDVNSYSENFNTGDSYACYTPNCSGSFPQSQSPLSNLAFNSARAYANPYTSGTLDPNKQQQPALINFTSPSDTSQFKANGKDYLNKPSDNGAMTRYSLYFPPPGKGIPTTWNTKGDLIATLVTSDASTRRFGVNAPIADTPSSYCYIATPASTANSAAVSLNADGEVSTLDPSLQVVYTCPSSNSVGGVYDPTKTDWKFQQAFNVLRGVVETAPYTGGAGSAPPAVTPTVNSSCPTDAYGRFGFSCGTPQNTDAPYSYLDPVQECRSYFDPLAYNIATDFTTGGTITQVGGTPRQAPVKTTAINARLPYNMRGLEPLLNRITTNTALKRISYHGWRCSWDFDSSVVPFMNRGLDSNSFNLWLDDANVTRANLSDGVRAEPFFHLSNYGYLTNGSTKQRIKYANGQRVAATNSDAPNVRDGVYLLHVQTYGGQFNNRFAIKAEYEFATPVCYSPGGQNCVLNPTPQVFGIGTLSMFVNATNTTGSNLNVIFDMAYIPRQYAGTQAVLELWDPGDVNTGLQIQLLEPSGFGQKLNAGVVPMGKPLTFRPMACPMYKANFCVVGSSSDLIESKPISGASWFNDQWLLLTFTVPPQDSYNKYDTICGTYGIPTTMCYYYQFNYKMTSNGVANDSITWSLYLSEPPVRLMN